MTKTIIHEAPAGTERGLILAQLGQLLEYPRGDYLSTMQSLCSSVKRKCTSTSKALEKFEQLLKKMTVQEIEELYTRTFDLAAHVSLYITGYIHGDENFDRGSLMAALGEKYQEIGFQTDGELPDHLRILLKVSAWLDKETLDELIEFLLLDPVAQIHSQLKDSNNPYLYLIEAVELVLKGDGGVESHD